MTDLPAPTAPPPPATDYATARACMVDSQVRPNKVVDPRIIQAMRRIPREHFVPPAMASRAYADEDVPLGGGRALMEPMVIARLVQMLRARDGETALVVAAGPGYGAALLHACGARVTALDDDPTMLALARAALPSWAPGVTLVDAPVVVDGWPAAAPYDLILIEGAIQAVPDALTAQLKPHGRLVTVLARPGHPGAAVLGEPVHLGASTVLRSQPLFDCATPALPQFKPAPAFVF